MSFEPFCSNAPGDILKLIGEQACQVCFGESRIRTKCFITNRLDLSLIGLDGSDELNLVTDTIEEQ